MRDLSAIVALALLLALSACGLERICVNPGSGCPGDYPKEDRDDD